MNFTASGLRAALAGLTLCAALAPATAATTLSITGPSSVALGSSFTLQVAATDVADLYAYQFDITFNPAAFQVGGVSEGAFLSTGGSTDFLGGMVDNSAGTVSFTLGTLIGLGVPGVNGSGVLASFSVTSIGSAPGVGTFGLANVTLLDSTGADISAGAMALNVSAVPEPATWGLLLAGGALVAGVARRRQAPARRGAAAA
ncbi:MAG: PEP-CTERM sorting domain-containing protein [Aquincola sp.]|nr:PEP-CTERM sorting domain-containing protein [Aquincola sp.]